MKTTPTTTAPTPPEGSWYIPYRLMQLADGSTLVKPLKPVQIMSARETAKFLKLSTKTLARLAESGFIRVRLGSPRIPQYFPGEIIEFLDQTIENPDFWTPERRAQYGLARRKKK